MLVFFIAGHETTATGLGFAINLLQQHPEAQKRAQEEVDEVLKGNIPDYAAVKNVRILLFLSKANLHFKLSYIGSVIKEALRLYPPVPVLARVLAEDTVLNGYIIPKGVRPETARIPMSNHCPAGASLHSHVFNS